MKTTAKQINQLFQERGLKVNTLREFWDKDSEGVYNWQRFLWIKLLKCVLRRKFNTEGIYRMQKAMMWNKIGQWLNNDI